MPRIRLRFRRIIADIPFFNPSRRFIVQLRRKVADRLSESIEDTLNLGNRINVIGPTGSGKTSTGKRLARILGFRFVEMDALFWGPNWTESPDEVLRARVEDAVRGDRWVIDGNYSRVQPIIWKRVDTVVWMDYPFRTVLWQLFRRTLRRVISKQELWEGTGNTERWGNAFASKDSLFVWLMTSFWRRRKRYARAVASPENSHIDFVRLTSRSQTGKWLSDLERETRQSLVAARTGHSQR